jgi:hypothetical protein
MRPRTYLDYAIRQFPLRTHAFRASPPRLEDVAVEEVIARTQGLQPDRIPVGSAAGGPQTSLEESV